MKDVTLMTRIQEEEDSEIIAEIQMVEIAPSDTVTMIKIEIETKKIDFEIAHVIETGTETETETIIVKEMTEEITEISITVEMAIVIKRIVLTDVIITRRRNQMHHGNLRCPLDILQI